VVATPAQPVEANTAGQASRITTRISKRARWPRPCFSESAMFFTLWAAPKEELVEIFRRILNDKLGVPGLHVPQVCDSVFDHDRYPDFPLISEDSLRSEEGVCRMIWRTSARLQGRRTGIAKQAASGIRPLGVEVRSSGGGRCG
jgi:hypothetical protein